MTIHTHVFSGPSVYPGPSNATDEIDWLSLLEDEQEQEQEQEQEDWLSFLGKLHSNNVPRKIIQNPKNNPNCILRRFTDITVCSRSTSPSPSTSPRSTSPRSTSPSSNQRGGR